MTTEPANVYDIAAALTYADEHSNAIVVQTDVAGVYTVDRHVTRTVEKLDLRDTLPSPDRPRGITELHTSDALVEFVNRHRIDGDGGGDGPSDDVDLFADLDQLRLVAVLNPNRPGQPGWSDHRAGLTMRRTPAWNAWRGIDGKAIPQEAFAEFVQEHASDIINPPAQDVLEMAETLVINSAATVSNATRLADGSRHIVFNEENTLRAGAEVEVDVPERITLRLPLFVGAEDEEAEVRVRYRHKNGAVFFAIQIIDVDDLERERFGSEVSHIAEALHTTALMGTPPGR